MTSPSPATTLRGAATGTFDAFFAAEYQKVLGVVVALVVSRAAAEDVAQEAFIKAYLRWRDVSVMDSPRAWVRRVAVNLATSRARSAAAETRALLRLGRREEAVDMPAGDADFWRAVRTLPRRQAQAVALHYAEDLNVDDVALVMNCAAGTVKAHLHAARKRLESVLGEGLS